MREREFNEGGSSRRVAQIVALDSVKQNGVNNCLKITGNVYYEM